MKSLLLTLLATVFAAIGFAQQKATEVAVSDDTSSIIGATWTPEVKKEISGMLAADFASKLTAEQQARVGAQRMKVLAACVVDKLAAAYSLIEVDEMPETMLQPFIRKAAKKCDEEMDLELKGMR